MKNWYLALQPQERLAVQLAGIVAALLLFYLLLWSPIVGDAAKLRANVAYEQNELAWLKIQAQKMAALSGSARPNAQAARQGQTLPQLSSMAAGHFSLSIDRYQQGNTSDELTVWLDNANFNQTLLWLQELQQQYGLAANAVNLSAGDSLGMVKVRVKFKDGNP